MDPNSVQAERGRIQSENRRREREVDPNLYAPWQPAACLMRYEAVRLAASTLHRLHVFPAPGAQCLEIGFGPQGWLGTLITWGVCERDLHGIELDAQRATRAAETLPAADLRVGDATELPWPNGVFSLVVASTVFTSILDVKMRRRVAAEVTRVLAPGGALVWYDFAATNPWNLSVRGVGRAELKRLFPELRGAIISTTLAPPIARLVAPLSWTLATVLQAVPLFHTHLLAVLIKPV